MHYKLNIKTFPNVLKKEHLVLSLIATTLKKNKKAVE